MRNGRHVSVYIAHGELHPKWNIGALKRTSKWRHRTFEKRHDTKTRVHANQTLANKESPTKTELTLHGYKSMV